MQRVLFFHDVLQVELLFMLVILARVFLWWCHLTALLRGAEGHEDPLMVVVKKSLGSKKNA